MPKGFLIGQLFFIQIFQSCIFFVFKMVFFLIDIRGMGVVRVGIKIIAKSDIMCLNIFYLKNSVCPL